MIERQEAYSVIYKVLKKNKFSSSLLNKQAKKIKTQEGNHEFFYTLVKGVIKRKGYLEYVASSFGHPKKYSKTDLKVKVLLYLGYYQLMYLDSVPDHSAVDETVKLAKTLYNQRTADFVNAMLRSYLRKPNIELPTEPIPRIAIEHSYPTELISSWVDIYGLENAEYLAMYFNEFPDINIRVNTYATTLEKLLKYFNNRDIELRTYPGIKNVFRAKDAQKALNDVGFSEGYYSIQDAAASLVVDLLDPLPKESIIDFFAAPGGKTTYMAEIMQNTGEVIAIDKYPKKVKLIKQACSRLQLKNVKLITNDAFKYGPVVAGYDKVLIDVPCSGWGVLGKKSELRWQTHQAIDELIKLQSNALIYASKFVKVGGYLVYSTCTMNPKENEEQIAKFLKRHINFELVNADKYIDKNYTSDKFLKTIPFKHNMDGAFGAKMKRIS